MNTLPAIPLQSGRRPHEIYHPQHPQHHPQYYHAYQQPYPPPQHYPQHPQWYPSPAYPQMAMPMRPYQHYPPMVNPPYSGNPSPLQHRPHPLQHTSSNHSRRDVRSPASSNTSLHVPSPAPINAPPPQTPTPPPGPPGQRMPYYPPLPWYSVDERTFPSRSPRRKRKKPPPQSSSTRVELPIRETVPSAPDTPRETPPETQTLRTDDQEPFDQLPIADPKMLPQEAVPSTQSTPVQEPSNLETPLTSHAPSESDSTQPTTPSSATASASIRPHSTQKPKSSHRPTPSIPIIPAIPHISLPSRPVRKAPISSASEVSKGTEEPPSNADHLSKAVDIAALAKEDIPVPSEQNGALAPATKAAPKSWADLVRTMAPPKPTPSQSEAKSPQTTSNLPTKTESLADALSSYSVESISHSSKISFLEPRGLVNTGNMCYMNSILQILVFCSPFFNFLDHVGKRAAHSFKSDTPLMDAMIMFMREFPIIDSAVSVEQLRMRLKANELEQYGEAFIPEFVYQVIRRLPRFSSMRRGHQQDAEEFLGFILEEMHDECGRSMRFPGALASTSGTSTPTNGVPHSPSETSEHLAAPEEWLEVGRKQKAAITRSSGSITAESPITKIFGGKLRSELRVPGMKNSVTLEPYQPLQLDIGASNVNNIIDALKGLTRSETLHGEFNSPRGPGSNATKQVTIETLPQVLILHLKRFQYDNTGGTQKIWKKIGYPLDLEIPKEVFPQHKRAGLLAHGALPRYRLIGVVYHHGKNASGGHYTVDVRRQDGREWIRIDDTVIRRIRSEDVAEGGSEEDPKLLAAALERHKEDSSKSGNVYDQLEEEENPQPEKEWSQVNGATPAQKKWSGVINGTSTPSTASGKMTPTGKPSIKDNKVAYILFYQKVSG